MARYEFLRLPVGQGTQMHGNCLLWALGMVLASGFTGSLGFRLVSGWPPKLRFYYVDASGRRWHFFPNRPKRGLAACADSAWFAGHIRQA